MTGTSARGVDLASPCPELELQDALWIHGLLIFRGQDITGEDGLSVCPNVV
jgi:hypothetical protein